MTHAFLLSDAELEEFIAHVIHANNRGVSAARNVTSDPNWTFGPALFFAGTILTTIGAILVHFHCFIVR